MPNIASALRDEITRLARKEVRSSTEALKRASVSYRASIASLRKEVELLRKELARARKSGKANSASDKEPGVDQNLRFRPEGLASHRKRLGLSAADFGRLIGVTGQTVYKWEQRRARPRAAQMTAIAAVRKLGRREALRKLEAAK